MVLGRPTFASDSSDHPSQEMEALRARLAARPRPWQGPRRDLEGITYVLNFMVDAEQTDDLRRLTGDLKMFRGGSSAIRVTHAEGWTRIEMGPEVLGAGGAIIRDPDGAALYLDPGGRTYLHLTSEQLPNWPEHLIAQIEATPAELGPREGPGRASSNIRRVVLAAESLRAEVDLDFDPRWERFREAVAGVVFGPHVFAHAHLEGLRHGLPVAGRLWANRDRAKPMLEWLGYLAGREELHVRSSAVPDVSRGVDGNLHEHPSRCWIRPARAQPRPA